MMPCGIWKERNKEKKSIMVTRYSVLFNLGSECTIGHWGEIYS